MANFQSLLLFTMSSILFLQAGLMCAFAEEDRKVYIVYMGMLPSKQMYSPSAHHVSLLQEVLGTSFSPDLMVRSYKRSFNGFAAKLIDSEAKIISSMGGVVSVFPSRKLRLLTTRSWDYIGLSDTAIRNPKIESDVIIGVIDTGIWPQAASFADEGFRPPPKKWRGVCKGGKNFTCNNKLIGARYYGSTNSARDEQGHGTHTASTAAGNIVKDVSFFGLAQGKAKGGVPSARIAAYKVCTSLGCESADVLAAFDDAIADGVDFISISLGFDNVAPLDKDIIAIGSFHAMEKGILTSHAAGNNGDSLGSVTSVAPWLLTVAASSTDRRIIDKVVLGNGKTLAGRSVNSFRPRGSSFPLVNGSDASTSNCTEEWARYCFQGCLDSHKVKGKIVLCEGFDGMIEAQDKGATGTIYKEDYNLDVSFVVSLPALALTSKQFESVVSYFNSTKHGSRPTANILKSEAIKDASAPIVASFSSRGPNTIVPEIMKPDVSAPGIDILAAFSPIAPPRVDTNDKRRVKYNILSGTSMACPHVSGIAAYIKSFHPDWSPSAIKSAIMTTAVPMNATTNSQTEFAYGSGHVNPVKATKPGLVYESSKEDYIKLLCHNGLDTKRLRLITGDNSSCPRGGKNDLVVDSNYPSLTAKVTAGSSFKVEFSRTVTNVGVDNSKYTVKVSSTSKLNIKVEPRVLIFKSLKETQSFKVIISGGGISHGEHHSASLVWFDGTHSVRTPIVVHTIEVDSYCCAHN